MVELFCLYMYRGMGEMGSKLSYIPTSLLLEINYRRLGVIFCKALKRWLKVYHQQHYLKTENY